MTAARTRNRQTARHDAPPAAGATSTGTWAVPVVVGVVLLLLVAVLVVRPWHGLGRLLPVGRPPAFPALADHPDPSLHGTVAYFDDRAGAVTVVAAAGAPSRVVYRVPPLDPAEAERLGKPVGPQLVFRDDGRLEITMFRMTKQPGPGFRPGWQKLVDLRTGQVVDTPAAEVPSTPVTGRPTVNAAGDRLVSSSSENGRVTVTLVTAAGARRTLLDVKGPGEGTYRLNTEAFWSPDGRWVLVDDGRILVVTPTDPPVTRVLTAASAMIAFDGHRFAVTGLDLLTPGTGG